MLRKGDKVVMHTCLEAETYSGKIWICKTDEFSRGEARYKQNSIFLEGFSSSFATEFLQKVNISETTIGSVKIGELVARNLTAWDTSKDKTQGLLPEVYWSNKIAYKDLIGEEYTFHKAVKKFNI